MTCVCSRAGVAWGCYSVLRWPECRGCLVYGGVFICVWLCVTHMSTDRHGKECCGRAPILGVGRFLEIYLLPR